jgi:MFS transporter, putative metabolite:H+ symporter
MATEANTINLLQSRRVSAVERLNRLPITAYYRQITFILGFVFFFDMGDINTLSFAAPAILKAWHLPIAVIGYLTSATFIGMFFGSTLAGWFSDRVGRKKALILTTVWYAGFSLLNAFAWEPKGLFITRMLTGLGISAMTVVGITYISELYPAKMRGSYQGWIMAIGLCGIPVTAYVARFFIPMAPWGWRLVFVWGSLGILFPLFSNALEESPRWYENHGRFEEADAALDRIEARVRADRGEELPAIPEGAAVAPARRGSYAELVSAPFLPRTAMLLFTWICFTLGFYGFTSWVPTLLVAHGISLIHSLTWSSAISLAAVPGALIAGLISDRWDRKWLIMTVALVIAVSGLLYGLTFKTATIIFFGFIVEMLLHCFSPLLYSYTAEAYPTEIRNSGTGLAYGTGRLVNVFGPLIVVFLFNHYGYTSVFVYMATTWIVLAITVALFGLRSRTLA